MEGSCKNISAGRHGAPGQLADPRPRPMHYFPPQRLLFFAAKQQAASKREAGLRQTGFAAWQARRPEKRGREAGKGKGRQHPVEKAAKSADGRQTRRGLFCENRKKQPRKPKRKSSRTPVEGRQGPTGRLAATAGRKFTKPKAKGLRPKAEKAAHKKSSRDGAQGPRVPPSAAARLFPAVQNGAKAAFDTTSASAYI